MSEKLQLRFLELTDKINIIKAIVNDEWRCEKCREHPTCLATGVPLFPCSNWGPKYER
jgi:hypothetical protein